MKFRFKKLNSLGLAHYVVPALAVIVIGGIGTYVLGINHADAAVPNLTCSTSWSPSGSTANPTSGTSIVAKATFGNNGGGETSLNYHGRPTLSLKSMSSPPAGATQWEFFLGSQSYIRTKTAIQPQGKYSPIGTTPSTSKYVRGLTHGQTATYTTTPNPFKIGANINTGSPYSVTLEMTYTDVGGHVNVCGSTKTYTF